MGDVLPRPTPPRRYRRKPQACPDCGSQRIASIIYGLPGMTPELERAVRAGRVVLGGCTVSDEDPARTCAGCGREFYRERYSEFLV